MKKNIIFLLIAVLCFVSGGTIVYLLNRRIVSNYSDIEFLSGDYFNKVWNNDNTQNFSDTECVPDMESAVQIANIIFSNKQKQGFFKEYELQQVFYDENDKVWIVSFWTPYDEKHGYMVGADFSIAISQKNGEILKTWVGE